MKNKGFVAVLTVVVTLLCLYYLSFTFISRKVQKDATAYATTHDGKMDVESLDSNLRRASVSIHCRESRRLGSARDES